jgi:hypothetical protein
LEISFVPAAATPTRTGVWAWPTTQEANKTANAAATVLDRSAGGAFRELGLVAIVPFPLNSGMGA